jgi:hypothetical protein
VDMPNSRGSIMSNSTQAASVLHGLHALAGGASSDKLKKIAGTLATARGGAATLHNVLRACDKAMSEHARRAPLDDLVKTLSAFSEHSYAPRCLPVVQTSLLQFAPGAFSLDQIDACITAFLRLDPSAGMMWLQVMAPRVCELLQALLTHSGDFAAVETSVRLIIAYTVGKCNASPLVVASVGDAVLNATVTADVTPALASSYADMLHAISETSASSQRVPLTELVRLAAVADRVMERMDTDAFFAVADVSIIALVVMCLPRLHQLTKNSNARAEAVLQRAVGFLSRSPNLETTLAPSVLVNLSMMPGAPEEVVRAACVALSRAYRSTHGASFADVCLEWLERWNGAGSSAVATLAEGCMAVVLRQLCVFDAAEEDRATAQASVELPEDEVHSDNFELTHLHRREEDQAAARTFPMRAQQALDREHLGALAATIYERVVDGFGEEQELAAA